MKKNHTYLSISILLISLISLNSCAPSSDMFAVDTTNYSDGIYSDGVPVNQFSNYSYPTEVENIAGDPSLGLYDPTDSVYDDYLKNKYLNDETAEAYYNVDTSNIYYVKESNPNNASSDSYNDSYSSNYSPYGMTMSMGIGMSFGYPSYGYGYPYYGYPGYGYPGYGYPGYGYPGIPIYPGEGQLPNKITNTKRNSKGGNYSSSSRSNNGIKYSYKSKNKTYKKNKSSSSSTKSDYSKYRGKNSRSKQSRSSNDSYYNKTNTNTRQTRSYNTTPTQSRPSVTPRTSTPTRSVRRTR